jgi:hypothetical protein
VSVVREEFGPTLPELVGARLGVPTRRVWLAFAVAFAVVVAIAAWLALRPTPGQSTVVVHEPLAYNLIYPDALRRVAPHPGETLRLESRAGSSPQSFAVKPLRLAPYKGDVTAAMTFLSSTLIDEMRSQYQQFVWRGDGRVNINKQPGYQIIFQARVDGRLTYGRRVMLVAKPDPPPRDGVDITILAARSPSVPNLDSVGATGALKTAYRSFRFGTDRP